MGLITSLVGALGSSDDDEEAIAAEAARRERERQEAEDERKAQQEALRAMREGTVERAQERREAGQAEMRGEETSSGEDNDTLGRFGGTGRRGEAPPVDIEEWTTPDQYLDRDRPENQFFDAARRGREQQGKPGDAPSFTMSVGEPEVSVTIPEDEIQVTPYAGPTTTSPGGRTVDLGALQQEADALDGDALVPGVVDPQLMGDPAAGPTITLDEPIEIQAQRSALGAMQQPAESGAALPAPPPPPSGPAGQPAPGSAAPSGAIAPPPQAGLPGTRLPGMQQATDAMQAPNPGGTAPSDSGRLLGAPGPADDGDDDVTRARRVERAMKVLGALLKVGGMAGGVAATMRGNPVGALAGAGIARGGSALTSAIGEGRGAQAERDRAVGMQRQRAERQDAMQALQNAMRQREMERRAGVDERRLGLEEDRVGVQKANAESLAALRQRRAETEGQLTEERRAQLEAQAERLRASARAAETDTRLSEEMNDPASRQSRNAQALVKASRGVLGPNLTLTDEQIDEMSAAELVPFVGEHGSIGRALGRRGGGGVGGRGRSGRNSTGANTQSAVPQAFLDMAAVNYPGRSRAEVEDIWDSMSAQEKRPFLAGERARDLSDDTEQMERAQVSGFRYTRDAPPTSDELKRRTEATTGFRQFNRSLRRMEELSGEMGVGGILGDIVGLPSDAVAEYDAERESVIAALKDIRGLGVLSDSDRRMLEASVPSSFRAFVAGNTSLEALRRGGRGAYVETMETLGYEPEGGGPQVGRGGRRRSAQRYRITVNGSTTELSAAGLAEARRRIEAAGGDPNSITAEPIR